MSQTIVAVAIQLLTLGLPMVGVTVGTEALTGTVQTLIIILSGLWIWIRRVQAGGVTPLGARM